MSAKFISIRTDGGNEHLISFLREHYSCNVKVLSNSLIYVENGTNTNNLLNALQNLYDLGFKIVEVTKIGENMTRPNDDGFELISKDELEDTISITKNSDINIVDYIANNNEQEDNIQIKKNKIDAFDLITSKEYLVRFTFITLVVMTAVKLFEILE